MTIVIDHSYAHMHKVICGPKKTYTKRSATLLNLFLHCKYTVYKKAISDTVSISYANGLAQLEVFFCNIKNNQLAEYCFQLFERCYLRIKFILTLEW